MGVGSEREAHRVQTVHTKRIESVELIYSTELKYGCSVFRLFSSWWPRPVMELVKALHYLCCGQGLWPGQHSSPPSSPPAEQ